MIEPSVPPSLSRSRLVCACDYVTVRSDFKVKSAAVCVCQKVNNEDRLCVIKVIKTLMNVLKFNMRYINLDV